MSASFSIIDFRELDSVLWNQYVADHPLGSVFHTTGMLKSFMLTPKYEVFAKAQVDAKGQIVALLASTRIETVSGLASNLASRAVMFAEPICNDDQCGWEAQRQLIALHDEQMQRRTLFSEIRPMHGLSCDAFRIHSLNYEHVDFLNYVIDLKKPLEDIWENIGKQTRASIRRSMRRGVMVEVGTSETAIRRAYPFIQDSYRRSKVPLVDIKLFLNAAKLLPPGTLQVRLATMQGKDLAGTIGLCYGPRYFAWYGGTSRPPGLQPFACLVWDEIQQSHQQGLAIYDFGGAGRPEEEYGPRVFKSRFHGQLVNHGRFRRVFSRGKLALAERGYKSLSLLFTKPIHRGC